MGAFQGELRNFVAPELGAAAIRAAVERAKVRPEEIDEVIMDCVLPAGQGQAPARQASLGAGLPLATGCTTINKMCGSGMKAAMLAHDLLKSESVDLVVAGGMESMTNAPYLLPKARAGLRMGHGQVLDHMFYDDLRRIETLGAGSASGGMSIGLATMADSFVAAAHSAGIPLEVLHRFGRSPQAVGALRAHADLDRRHRALAADRIAAVPERERPHRGSSRCSSA